LLLIIRIIMVRERSLDRHVLSESWRQMLSKFTRRQREIIELLCQGNNVNEVAEALCISPYTVRRHLSCLYEKFGIKNQVQLVVLYLKYSNYIENTVYGSNDSQNLLSYREHEVWDLYRQGLISKQISGRLQISESTVREYIRRIRKKLSIE